ncbi:MAG: hypothetical protein RI957_639 [Verrucomicrobiota bacterium]
MVHRRAFYRLLISATSDMWIIKEGRFFVKEFVMNGPFIRKGMRHSPKGPNAYWLSVQDHALRNHKFGELLREAVFDSVVPSLVPITRLPAEIEMNFEQKSP